MKSFLVVDDNESMLRLYDILLKNRYEGAEVTRAATGREAMGWVEKREFGAILSDIDMPVMNGLDFYRQLKSVRPAQAGRFSFISAMDTAEVEGFVKTELVPFLSKPFATDDFYRFVEEMLSRGSREFIASVGRFCGRRHPRTKMEESCLIRPARGKGAPVEGRTLDSSKGGVAVSFRGGALAKGELARVDIGGLKIFEREARVAWSQNLGDEVRAGLCWFEAA